MAATERQRAAVTGRSCIVCGTDRRIDAAHLIPRSLGGCGHPAYCVPLCRWHHRAYDRGELDLLPYLEPAWRAQLAHAVGHMGLIGALRRISGTRRSAPDSLATSRSSVKAEERPRRWARRSRRPRASSGSTRTYNNWFVSPRREPPMSGPVPRILHRALGTGLATVVLCLAAAGCGGSRHVRRAPTQRDVATIEAAMVDITNQCQSSAASVPAANTASLRGDVNALLRTYRIVLPDARLSIGALRTTPHRELKVAQTDLQDGCAPQQARRLAAATENH
jgi:hypothetical protein